MFNMTVDRPPNFERMSGSRAWVLGYSCLGFLLASLSSALASTGEPSPLGQNHAVGHELLAPRFAPAEASFAPAIPSLPRQDPVADADGQKTESDQVTAGDSDAAANAGSEPQVTPPETAAPPTPLPVAPTTASTDTVPLESRQRVVRTIRFAVVVGATLLAMLSTVVLLKINRWTHGKYMGRLWWAGVLLVSGWLLAGWLWAWNNELWATWLDGPLF